MKNKGLFTKKIGFIILIIGLLISIVLFIFGFSINNEISDINSEEEIKNLEIEIDNLEKEKINIFFKEGFSNNYDLISKEIVDKTKLKNKLFNKNNYLSFYNLDTNTKIYLLSISILVLTLFLSLSIFIGSKRRKIIINKIR